jgi:HAMP domain-containing protein
MAKKNGNWIGLFWALVIVLLLAGWAVSLVLPRPTAAFHGDARWIGENMSVGIPVLCAFALFTAFMVQRWLTRDQRKLDRLVDQRLRHEGNHPTQQRIERERELKGEAVVLEREAAELRRKAKEQVREEIKKEQHLREERLREARSVHEGLNVQLGGAAIENVELGPASHQ